MLEKGHEILNEIWRLVIMMSEPSFWADVPTNRGCLAAGAVEGGVQMRRQQLSYSLKCRYVS
jgi:hypothetical protein